MEFPFNFQAYRGDDPPFTGVAVNVTWEVGHAGLVDAEIVMLVGCDGRTAMVITLEVTGLATGHGTLVVS
jgi:hypothetical protein